MQQNKPELIVREQFNRQARKFSKWSVTKNREYAHKYFQFCEMTDEDRLLDISCGSGEFCIFCAKKIRHATGVDLSEKMIALAGRQSAAAGTGNATFQQGDATRLPYEDETFSIVISKSAFHHYKAYNTIFKQMKRCCKKQGKISIQDIVAFDDPYVNNYFESFERLVDKSHKTTCTRFFLCDLYKRHHVELLSVMEVAIDLNLNEYLNHAVRSNKEADLLRQQIEKGLKDDKIKPFFHCREDTLFFKRNVILLLGQK